MNQTDLKMKYTPKLTDREIEDNHLVFMERISLYKKRGLDIIASRKFIIDKSYPLNGSILEIGTGNGYTTLALAKAGYEIISIDNDREALKKTALNLAYENILSQVTFFVMDANSLSFEDNSFNNVICINMLHHIDSPNKIFLEMDKVLRADGKLVLADFNQKGMEIVNSIHKQEGRTHKDSGIRGDYVYSYFHGLGYEIKKYADEHHWILIGKKKIQL